MNKTIGDLRYSVAAFLNRDPSSFLINGQDLLHLAINSAKQYCQRKLNFELARVQAQVNNMSVTAGGYLSNAVLKGTSTPVSTKMIKAAFLTVSNEQLPIEVISRDAHLAKIARLGQNAAMMEIASTTAVQYPFVLIQMGDLLYVAPASPSQLGTTFTLYLDVIKWLPDYRIMPSGSTTSMEQTSLLMRMRLARPLASNRVSSSRPTR